MAVETQAFLKAWGMSHHLSSMAYPHSNCRAEVGVKTLKWIIMDNMDTDGDINIPKFQRDAAILQHTGDAGKHVPGSDSLWQTDQGFHPHQTWSLQAMSDVV
jgi:hypothetical protein